MRSRVSPDAVHGHDPIMSWVKGLRLPDRFCETSVDVYYLVAGSNCNLSSYHPYVLRDQLGSTTGVTSVRCDNVYPSLARTLPCVRTIDLEFFHGIDETVF